VSHSFDTALINRERNRQLLAEVLEEKYSAERRNQEIKKFAFIAIVLGIAIFSFHNSKNEKNELGGLAATPKKKKLSSQEILEQMQKQMNERDQMIIGAEATQSGSPDEDIEQNAQSKNEPESFAEEEVPIRLGGEVRRKNKKSDSLAPLNAYGKASAEKENQLETLKKHRISSRKLTIGLYRPATIGETEKHSPPSRTVKFQSGKDRYVIMEKLPARLASDARAFPDNH